MLPNHSSKLVCVRPGYLIITPSSLLLTYTVSINHLRSELNWHNPT